MPLFQSLPTERRKFTFGWLGKRRTATKLKGAEEETPVRIDNQMYHSCNEKAFWKPSDSASRSDKPPQISPPKFQGWSGASTGGAYLDEASALSHFLLVDRDRYQQIENDKRARVASVGNDTVVHEMGAMETTDLFAPRQRLQDNVGEYFRPDDSISSIRTSMNGSGPASDNGFTRVQVSPTSGDRSWTNTPESKYAPFVAARSDKIEGYTPLLSSSAPSLEDISLYDGSTYVPHSSARTSMKHATNAALYDGSSWGPTSPRTLESKVLPPDVQLAVQEQLTKNRANRLSLPPALRYNPSQRAPNSASTWPSAQHGKSIASPLKTSQSAAEFKLSLVGPPSDDSRSDNHAIPNASSWPTSEKMSLRPAETSMAANSRPLTQHTPKKLPMGLPHQTRRAQRASNPRPSLIMTDAQLIGQPFAIPFRSHSAIRKRAAHSSVPERRSVKNELSDEGLKQRPRDARGVVRRAA